MKPLTREWLRKAEGDFQSMESLARSRRPGLDVSGVFGRADFQLQCHEHAYFMP
jgi:hypothetical protein